VLALCINKLALCIYQGWQSEGHDLPIFPNVPLKPLVYNDVYGGNSYEFL
jgi:hypothetical protein